MVIQETEQQRTSLFGEQIYNKNWFQQSMTITQSNEFSTQSIYYAQYSSDQVLSLIAFTEMIIFHSLILLMHSKKDKSELYEEEFYKIIKNDFIY